MNLILFALLLIGLPLVGVLVSGKPVADYLEFPPITRYVSHAPFSWPVFICLACLILCVVLSFDVHIFRNRKNCAPPKRVPVHRFPWWGWFGVFLVVSGWLFAWTRFSWFARLQIYTFGPLWVGYIFVVNALAKKRCGNCMITDRPAFFFSLFLASAVFWWFFEFLNRFVQNWYYGGIGELSSSSYVLFATFPFSTVLPGVIGTYELIKTFPLAGAGMDDFIRVNSGPSKAVPWAGLLLACGGLFGIGVWPDYLFFSLWLAPLLLITSLQAILGKETIFSGLKHGDWQRLYLMAVSALICGFFWEMWNFFSLAQWHYTIPFVEKFRVFEMPVLGYAGYIPFGLECAVISDMVAKFILKCCKGEYEVG